MIIKYPLFDDKFIIEKFKRVVEKCGVSAAKAVHELEHYRVHYNPEGASIYQHENDLQKLPNPLTYLRYYADPDMEALPKVAKTIFILRSSSVCEQSFRDHEYIYSNKRLRMNVD